MEYHISGQLERLDRYCCPTLEQTKSHFCIVFSASINSGPKQNVYQSLLSLLFCKVLEIQQFLLSGQAKTASPDLSIMPLATKPDPGRTLGYAIVFRKTRR